MKKYIVIDGAGASSRKGYGLLENVFKKQANKDPCVVLRSINKKHVYRILDNFFESSTIDDEIVVIAKSQGAWRWLEYSNSREKQISRFNIHAITIDPHPWNNWIKKIWSRIIGKKYKISTIIDTTNIYQTNRYPRGCSVYGAFNIFINDPSVDHFNIINSETVTRAINGKIDAERY